MSKELSDIAITEFQAATKHAYQSFEGNLANAIMKRGRVRGGTVRFNKMGKGLAKKRTGVGQQRQLMNVAHDYVETTFVDYEAPEMTDIFDTPEVPIDEVKELAKTIMGAIGRREDQEIIDTLVAATPTNQVATSIGGSNTGLNTSKLRRARRLLDDSAPGHGKLHFVSTPIQKEDLLGDDKMVSSDYQVIKRLVDGEVDSAMGFTFHWIETSRDEGGLPLTTNTRTNFAWEEDGALGHRTALNGEVRVSWEEMYGSWLSVQDLKVGTAIIDELGTCEISCHEA